MKKILFIFSLLMSTLSFAQIQVTRDGGNVIANNEVFEYGNVGNTLEIHVTNTGSATTYVKTEIVSMSNASGSNLQYCFNGLCYAVIVAGNEYPAGAPLQLASGASNNNYDHFISNDTGTDVTQPVEYTIRIYETDASGTDLNTSSTTFTYRFNPNLSSASFSALTNLGVSLKNTLVTNTLYLHTQYPVTFSIYDVTGKKIKESQLYSGDNTVSVGNLNTGVYILNFKNSKGQRAITKIIKK